MYDTGSSLLVMVAQTKMDYFFSLGPSPALKRIHREVSVVVAQPQRGADLEW